PYGPRRGRVVAAYRWLAAPPELSRSEQTPTAGGAGVRRVGLDDAVRPDAAPVPARVGRGAPPGGGVRVRHPPDADHERALWPRPRSRAGAGLGGGNRFLWRPPDRRRARRPPPGGRAPARPRPGGTGRARRMRP